MTPERLAEIKKYATEPGRVHYGFDISKVIELIAEVERLREGIIKARNDFCGDMIKSDLQELWNLVDED
jgi:hypothetical protein